VTQPLASLTGACKSQYIAAANGRSVFVYFYSTDTPVGVANNLYSCDVDYCTAPPASCLGLVP
jgi:hypothetical protein